MGCPRPTSCSRRWDCSSSAAVWDGSSGLVLDSGAGALWRSSPVCQRLVCSTRFSFIRSFCQCSKRLAQPEGTNMNTKTLTLLLQFAGLLHLGLLCAGLMMPRVVGLRIHLARLPSFIRRLFWVYYA